MLRSIAATDNILIFKSFHSAANTFLSKGILFLKVRYVYMYAYAVYDGSSPVFFTSLRMASVMQLPANYCILYYFFQVQFLNHLSQYSFFF